MILNAIRPTVNAIKSVDGKIAIGNEAVPVTNHLLQVGEYVTNDPQVNFTQVVVNHNGQGASGIQFNTDVDNEVIHLRNINGDADLYAKNNVRITSGLSGNIIFSVGDELAPLTLEADGDILLNGVLKLSSQTVTSSVATASTHKLAININGTTYYLLATNV